MVSPHPQVAVAELDPKQPQLYPHLTGPPKSPLGQPTAFTGPSGCHVTSEQQSQNMGEGTHSPRGHLATSPVIFLKKVSIKEAVEIEIIEI